MKKLSGLYFFFFDKRLDKKSGNRCTEGQKLFMKGGKVEKEWRTLL